MARDRHLEVWPGHFAEFMARPLEHPIDMLNLLRFRDLADYPPGHANAGDGLSGAQAFRIYTRDSYPAFTRAGGALVWSGNLETMLIGPVSEHWHLAFIARYPSRQAFLESLAAPDYKLAVVHRQAALETSRLICLKAADAPAG